MTGNGVQVTANTPVDAPQEVLPLTPEQRPAAAPLVIYLNGKLSISAKNSTLGDVLRAIAAKTGAAIDVPENANERVVSQLGPGLRARRNGFAAERVAFQLRDGRDGN